ncbi:TPA: homeobox domain-containing protein [Stenotrophomonas maltophilia]|nr:homeobox domain-containing protein [Stenotrophomonas maltophilia]
MKGKVALAGLLVLVVVLTLYLVNFRGRSNASTSAIISVEPSAESAVAAAGDATGSLGSATSSRKMGGDWGARIEIGDPLYNAKTTDELEWFRRNGYPSMAQREEVAKRSVSQADLEEFPKGDPVGILVAEAILQRDSGNSKADDYLRESSIHGSIYALEALARTKPEVDGSPSIERAAYYKAAAMRGNWVVDLAGATYVKDERAAMLSSLVAQQVLGGIDTARGQLGMDPLVRDPKPGLIEFINATKVKK